MLNNYPPSSTDSQHFWGLVSVPNPDPASWQPLPAFHTYRRLMALMADGTAPYSPSSLSVTVGGAADVKSFLVGKRDGSYLLALWRDVSLWDRKTRKPLTPSAATVNVTFAAPKMGTVYMPSIRDAAFSSSRGTSHSIQLRGNLAVLKITA